MKRVTFARALALGAGSAFARPGAALLLALAAMGAALTTTLLWTAGLATLAAPTGPFLPGLGVSALAAWLLEAAVLGGAVLQASARLRGSDAPSLGVAVRSAAPRALGWAVLAAAALLAWQGWQLLVSLSGLALFVRGLFLGTGGLTGALALALVLTLGPPVALFLQLVVEMALVRSVTRDESPATAGWEAARALLARPWAPIALWALTALLMVAVAGAAAVIAGMAPPRLGRYALPLMAVELGIGSLAAGVGQLVRLGAFTALELDRTGELPAPPPKPASPAPVMRAELVFEGGPILEAVAVDPPTGTPTGTPG